MFDELVLKSREENNFLSYPIIPFVKVKGTDCRCEMHKKLRMNPGTIKSHIRKTHRLNFETGNPHEINQESLQDLPEQKVWKHPEILRWEAEDNYFWDLATKVKEISKIKDPEYAIIVVKHSLSGKLREDLLELLNEKSSDLFWEKRELQKAKEKSGGNSDIIDPEIKSRNSTRIFVH